MLCHEPFERGALNAFRAVERSLRTQRAEDARVEQEQFRMGDGVALRAPREYRHAERQQQVLEDLDVRGDRLALDLALPGDVASPL